MLEKNISRGKSRRVSTGTPTASSESELNWNEAILGQGAAGCGSQGTGKDTDLSASELYELQRRCFSCCNVVLQQRASVEDGKRMMLMQQPKFTEHPLLKAIMERVSRRGYMDVTVFVDDFTRLIGACVGQQDRQAVLEALDGHVERTGQVDPRRPFKATFQGFPHPIMEDMMTHSALARKKLPPGALSHVSIDVGRYFAQAYGLGLSKGAKFCGKPSQEMVFLEQRKKKEAEAAASGVSAKVVATGSKAQKKGRLAGNQGGGSKKKSKVQPVSHATTKPTRCLRITRRQSSAEGNASRIRPLFDSDDGHDDLSRNGVVQRRVKLRSKVHCHHLQGQLIEMDDPEYGGKGFSGRLEGTVVSCCCGCGATMSGTHWLIHNGGRYSRRQSGFPYRFLRLAETKENVAAHFELCDCHEHLCDTCNSWEAPGAPMTECYICHTSVHATEECAVRVIVSGSETSLAGKSTVSDPNGIASATTVADSRGKATREGARSQVMKAANSSSVDKEEGNMNSPASLAWRRPAAGGTPSMPGTTARSRSSRRKTADQGALDDPGAHVLVEGDSHDAGIINKAESFEGRKATGRGGGKATVRDVVVVWKCHICARPGMTYPSWN